MSAPSDLVLLALEARGCRPRKVRTGWEARCPAHEDRKPSLSVAEGQDGRVLLTCHAGCSLEAITAALGMEVKDLFPTETRSTEASHHMKTLIPEKTPPQNGKAYPTANEALKAYGLGKPSKWWPYYRDGDSNPCMVVARWNTSGGKIIRPVFRDSAGWKQGALPAPRPLYRVSELLVSPPGTPVVITEGEKAADAAAKCGLVAVTSSGGSNAATKSDWRPLRGRRVIILPDNDAAGERYAGEVAALCQKAGAASVKIIRLAAYADNFPEGADLADVAVDRHWLGLPIGENASLEDLGRWILQKAEELPEATTGSKSVATGDLVFEPVVVPLANIQAEPVKWLWRNRIPLGRITLVVGRPGQGKSFLCTDFAARVTTGTPWPDGEPCEKGSVVILSLEDDPHDTIRPRLDAHCADVAKTFLVKTVQYTEADGKRSERAITLGDISALECVLTKCPDCRLLIIDPVGDFIGSRTDTYKDNEVRAVLCPLGELARKYNVAVLVVVHRRKAVGGSADDSAMGSRAFTGIARSVWHVTRDPHNKTRRLFLPGKQNLGPESSGLAFQIEGEPPRVVWERGAVSLSADEAVEAESNGSGREAEAVLEAKTFLKSALSNGPRSAKDVAREWREAHGGSERTLHRAKRELGVESIRERVPGPWLWVLPNQKGGMTEAPTLPNPTLPTDTKLKTFGNLGNVAWNTAFFDDSTPQDCQHCQHCQLGNLAGNLGDVEANETLPTSNQSESTKDTTPKGGSDQVDLSEIGTHDAKTITSSQKGGRPKTVFKVMETVSPSPKLHEKAVLRSYGDGDSGDETTPQPPTGEPDNDTTPKGGSDQVDLSEVGGYDPKWNTLIL